VSARERAASSHLEAHYAQTRPETPVTSEIKNTGERLHRDTCVRHVPSVRVLHHVEPDPGLARAHKRELASPQPTERLAERTLPRRSEAHGPCFVPTSS
jgi:hypothetical protein